MIKPLKVIFFQPSNVKKKKSSRPYTNNVITDIYAKIKIPQNAKIDFIIKKYDK
jgi:hypothetical protein